MLATEPSKIRELGGGSRSTLQGGKECECAKVHERVGRGVEEHPCDSRGFSRASRHDADH